MCGRYAMALRPSQVRQILQNDYDLQVDDAPADEGGDAPRQSYNFAPGYNGVVYRADVGERGAAPHSSQPQDSTTSTPPPPPPSSPSQPSQQHPSTPYKLQSMKWGLIPSWTKSSPSALKTINCRDDSLAHPGGMWASIKSKKRCIVIAQGFYEWLHKGKEKIPHYIKRKDGKLLLLAGLWDCAITTTSTTTLPSSPPPNNINNNSNNSNQKIWTYTIITTSSNPQLRFLHDRMPVILDPGSPELLRKWLDPKRCEWSGELQEILKPYEAGEELEVYPVSKEVGKVGNSDPAFVVPVASRKNKGNIANFFANAAAKGNRQQSSLKEEGPSGGEQIKRVDEVKKKEEGDGEQGVVMAVGFEGSVTPQKRGVKREAEMEDTEGAGEQQQQPPHKKMLDDDGSVSNSGEESSPVVMIKPRPKISATSNNKSEGRRSHPAKKKGRVAPAGGGSQKITKFFGK